MNFLTLIIFSVTTVLVSCKEYVPVLVWSTQTTADTYPVVPALKKLNSDDFSDYLLKRVKVDHPTILLFMEENLSVEDFSWKDVYENGAYPQLSNITQSADDVAFLPAVHDPYKGLKKLKKYGYVWRNYEHQGFDSLKDGKNAIFEIKLEEPDFLEDRPDMLKKHDDQMAKIYAEALNYKSDVMVIYSGNHSSWIDAELERFKREERDANDSSTLIIADVKNIVRMAATLPIIFQDKSQNKTPIQINKIVKDPTISTSSKNLTLRVKFLIDNNPTSFDFKFTSDPSQENWWTLDSVDIEEPKVTDLLPSVDVGAPGNHSFFCNPTVVFSKGNISLTFENFQVQPRVGEGKSFGPILHCVPYFSIAIWSGLVVVFILSVVLAWGIVMIMDINTNDRFDDPKGKTITITAAD